MQLSYSSPSTCFIRSCNLRQWQSGTDGLLKDGNHGGHTVFGRAGKLNPQTHPEVCSDLFLAMALTTAGLILTDLRLLGLQIFPCVQDIVHTRHVICP